MGEAVFASDEENERLKQILKIISNGSFPFGTAQPLTKRQRSQLRDAMIFEAHVRSGADAFVTTDSSAFIKDGRRSLLGRTFSTRILDRNELEKLCSS